MKRIHLLRQLTFLLWLSLTPLSTSATNQSLDFDPTLPDSVEAGSSTGQQPWKLTSTVITKQRQRAVINGITVTGPGDQIMGATVTAIRAGAVDLKTTTGVKTLRLVDGINH